MCVCVSACFPVCLFHFSCFSVIGIPICCGIRIVVRQKVVAGIITGVELCGKLFGNCRQIPTAIRRTTAAGLTRGNNTVIRRSSCCRVILPWVLFPVVESPKVQTCKDNHSNDREKDVPKNEIVEREEAIVVVVVGVGVASSAGVVRYDISQAGVADRSADDVRVGYRDQEQKDKNEGLDV